MRKSVLSDSQCISLQTYANQPHKFELRTVVHNMDISLYSKEIEGKLVIIGLIWVTICLISINISESASSALNEEMEHKKLTTGKINGTLKNEDENTNWLLSGTWKSNLFTNAKFNHTNPAKFSAKINMVMPNGSSPHIHKISHFTLTNISTQGHSTVYEGTLPLV